MLRVLKAIKLDVPSAQEIINNSNQHFKDHCVEKLRYKILQYCFLQQALNCLKNQKIVEVPKEESAKASESADSVVSGEVSSSDQLDKPSYSFCCDDCGEVTFYSNEELAENDLNLKDVCLTDTCIYQALIQLVNEKDEDGDSVIAQPAEDNDNDQLQLNSDNDE